LSLIPAPVIACTDFSFFFFFFFLASYREITTSAPFPFQRGPFRIPGSLFPPDTILFPDRHGGPPRERGIPAGREHFSFDDVSSLSNVNPARPFSSSPALLLQKQDVHRQSQTTLQPPDKSLRIFGSIVEPFLLKPSIFFLFPCRGLSPREKRKMVYPDFFP